MRWLVEASSVGKADAQKFVVEAESWQRALQAARTQRGDEGPMSGFSIELLEEGYRAVDPVARIRFVVKRAPDEAPVAAPLARDTRGAAPAAPATAAEPAAAAPEAKVPPAPISSSPSAAKSVPPRPATEKQANGPAQKGGLVTAATEKEKIIKTSKESKERRFASASVPAAPLLPIGAAIPGLPSIKLLSSREQDPTDASPLTYREYAFAVPAGTSEEVAGKVLEGQLKIVDSHLASTKEGKLVNLAVFDVEFTGKPPSPPLATLTWKDWKGEPVIGYPRRGAAHEQPKPPAQHGAAPTPAPAASASAVPVPPAPAPPAAPMQTAPVQVISAPAAPAPKPASVPPPAPKPASVPPPAPKPASIPPPAPKPASIPPPAPKPASAPPPAPKPASIPPAAAAPAPAASQPPPRRSSAPDGMVRTPSGRFVRGRAGGDELITLLFESMHDLHFLRDALEGGQFCLALATEVLPARAALLHFFDIEKREWIIACTLGKDTDRLLTLRTPDGDELLRDAARKRRAVVLADPASATAQRYQSLGDSRSMIIAPIMQAGRALGAIEIINPLDGMPFTEDEANAMTYIAEQYAEYLGSRGIVLDRERIRASASLR